MNRDDIIIDAHNCPEKLADYVEKLQAALQTIISEPYNNHWRDNNDGTKTNLWPMWAREFAYKAIGNPVKTKGDE